MKSHKYYLHDDIWVALIRPFQKTDLYSRNIFILSSDTRVVVMEVSLSLIQTRTLFYFSHAELSNVGKERSMYVCYIYTHSCLCVGTNEIMRVIVSRNIIL